MKEHVVEIKGGRYRYHYDPELKRTVYDGPVGFSPPLTQDEFEQFFRTIYDMSFEDNQKMVSEIREIADQMEGEVWMPANAREIILGTRVEEGWEKINAGRSLRYFRGLYSESGDDVDDRLAGRMAKWSMRMDDLMISLPTELAYYITNPNWQPKDITDISKVDASKMLHYFASMLEA